MIYQPGSIGISSYTKLPMYIKYQPILLPSLEFTGTSDPKVAQAVPRYDGEGTNICFLFVGYQKQCVAGQRQLVRQDL